mmetsp:Transcript_37014/g.98012  ORF Transcript_37014/g.98012 Transcript_37014/m.98012 type:complete len:203 (-) Transcript_37014:148-756(-)
MPTTLVSMSERSGEESQMPRVGRQKAASSPRPGSGERSSTLSSAPSASAAAAAASSTTDSGRSGSATSKMGTRSSSSSSSSSFSPLPSVSGSPVMSPGGKARSGEAKAIGISIPCGSSSVCTSTGPGSVSMSGGTESATSRMVPPSTVTASSATIVINTWSSIAALSVSSSLTGTTATRSSGSTGVADSSSKGGVVTAHCQV